MEYKITICKKCECKIYGWIDDDTRKMVYNCPKCGNITEKEIKDITVIPKSSKPSLNNDLTEKLGVSPKSKFTCNCDCGCDNEVERPMEQCIDCYDHR